MHDGGAPFILVRKVAFGIVAGALFPTSEVPHPYNEKASRTLAQR